ncbi:MULTISPECIES: multidrug efflux SMR transporter [Malaciobacter]|jgi:quaternary ammonium compound-resistance protein SugE|uniref:Guanidinium exporter n=2 Tax=Malaciobacter TaxID=2321114 RepID=A0AB36ZU49_9BACT|nr:MULTISPECIES: multidrug efflux SMR transporter [Malaciobacter]PHO11220.1 QacE family quaternary ammonium compound efflux SMR transporter [Malaciobacter canalis]PPK60712.1 quaternary ammonium compound-resistance protein SugE [Malaciobacter marinus]QEE33313.1 QacE family quaternary ammonium compound efflux SMR transporter [Malaciobacter canalis]SKB53806.1 quaternary ammonium compound-resistance protein SugE [Malaciobacter marinus]
MSAWIYLILAGVLEVGFASMLKLTENFTKLIPTLIFILFAVGSFISLTKAVQHIPIGTAYAIWTGIGAFGTIIIGILFYKEPASMMRLFFLFTLISSIIGLKLVSN